MIAIVDYSIGNVFSVRRSLESLGVECLITGDPDAIRQADQVILPGVGAFRDAIGQLEARNLVPVLRQCAKDGTPLLGICLGMQLLFERSWEYGKYEGLGLLEGEIVPIQDDLPSGCALKVPQIGWNPVRIRHSNPLTAPLRDGDAVYFVHSYYAKCPEEETATVSDYGIDIPGIVWKGNVYGCQFHPEKSGAVGLSILKAFSRLHRSSAD